MAVETESRFDVSEEVDDLMEVDVYNFLYMVSNAGGTNSNLACIGNEVDDLMEMDEVADLLFLKKVFIFTWILR